MNDGDTRVSMENFVASGWRYDAVSKDHYGYSSVMQSLQKLATDKEESGEVEQASVLNLLSRVTSMMLTPISLNEPFKPYFQDFQGGRRSAIPDDFTPEELTFFEEVLDVVEDPWLKARLADVLWLCRKTKNPEHAKMAISAYTAHEINSDSWRRDVDDCWHRAARLCLQIKYYEKLEEIKKILFSAFEMDYPDCTYMQLWLAQLLNEVKIDNDIKDDISLTLYCNADDLHQAKAFSDARSYFELAAIKFKQTGNIDDWLLCLVSIAECFENEADVRSSGSQMVANSFYENAIQAYRKIPVKHRAEFDIEIRMRSIRNKMMESGQASLNEMSLIKTPGIDISDTVKASISHVSGKESLEAVLMCFSGLYPGPSYQELKESAEASMREYPLSSLFGATHMAADGRVVAKTPSVNFNSGEDDPANQAILQRQIIQQFTFEMQLVVEGQVLPALHQLLMEHRFTPAILEGLCYHSPFVAPDRNKLTAYALWLGFEHDFSNAIYLLCPQFEHCVRMKLKEVGAHTSNVDRDGIENENGLSTLMDLPEAMSVFGEDRVFEIKAIFTDSLGSNLRNEVAHGLLDVHSASSLGSIYAWWMILRFIVRSLMSPSGSAPNKAEVEVAEGEDNE